MITLGYIVRLPITGDNLFKVSIPLFKQAGSGDSASIFDANLCYTPGNLNGYRVGDCVVLGFLNNYMNNPIILGKLYTAEAESASNFSFANSLEVTESAKLPKETSIGEITYDKLLSLNRLTEVLADLNDLK